MKTNYLHLGVLVVIAALLLASCQGGSTEIGNARTVTGKVTDGKAAAFGATAELVEENYIPGNSTDGVVFTSKVDCYGNYMFKNIPFGSYYLNAERNGKVLLRGPFAIEDEDKNLATAELKVASKVTVTVEERDDVNVVYVKGTTASYEVKDGKMEIPAAPDGELTIIGYKKNGAVPKNISSVSSQMVTVNVEPKATVVTTFKNSPPRIVTNVGSYAHVVDPVNRNYFFTVDAVDNERDAIRYTLLAGPQGMMIDSSNGEIVWTAPDSLPSGSYPVTVRVSDVRGTSSTVSWNVTIAEKSIVANDSVSIVTGKTGKTYIFTAKVDDPKKVNALRFSFGDGDTTEWQQPLETSHLWQSPGVYDVSFQVQYLQNAVISEWKRMAVVTVDGVDLGAPVITLLGGDTVKIELNDPNSDLKKYLDVNNQAYQFALGQNGARAALSIINNTVDIFHDNEGKEPYVITYKAIDDFGNQAQKNRFVFVIKKGIVDVTPPSIVLVGDSIIQIEVGTKFVDPGAIAYDLGDSKNIPVTVSGTVDDTKVGAYTIVYTAKDSKENAISITRVVKVNFVDGGDPVPPVITLLGPDTMSVLQGQTIDQFKASFVEPGYSATDARDGDVTKNVKVSPITYQNDAVYYIQYDVKDASGNAAETKYRYIKTGVSIIESYPPVIILVYGDSVLQVIRGTKWVEPGFAVTDVQDKTIPSSQVIVDSSDLVNNLNTLGTYKVTYTVTNSIGLTSVKERTVKVISAIVEYWPPRITLLGRNPDTVLVLKPYIDPGFTAVDDRGDDITASVVRTGIVDTLHIGKNTLDYSVTDSRGNRGTAQRTVWVVIDTVITDLLVRYNVPSADPLPTINGTFTLKAIDGDGPDLSKVSTMGIDWNAQSKELVSMAINLSVDPYFVYLQDGSLMTHTFGAQSSAAMDIRNTGVSGIDGKYFVTVINGQFIWVEQHGKYALLWEKSN